MLRTALRLASLVGALMLLTTSVAIAAPGGNKASSSSSITLVTTTAAATTATSGPRYGDTVTFAVSTDATSQPFVHLKCFQNGVLVLENWKGYFADALGTQSFTLGTTPAWQAGAADCTAYLENWDSYSKNGRTTVLASTSFH